MSILYETITSQLPDENESASFLKLVNDLHEIYGDHPALADKLCAGEQLEEGMAKPELAAWTMLVSTFYNLDITRTRN